MKRILKDYKAKQITNSLQSLAQLRLKASYKKISEHKRVKLRNRIRETLGRLRYALPRQEGIEHPCDPTTWDVRYPTEQERKEAADVWNMIVSMVRGY